MSKSNIIYNVAIYLRLSKEDGDKEESESITNQRDIINDYIDGQKNMKIFNEYIDDGYTGTNFNRPGFKKMISDIEKGRIDIVITKNLARLGRNHIEAGEYIEKFFPDHRVRYIAILDRVDTFEENSNNDFIPIKSVFNEKYCKDTSVVVKKSKRKRMQEGYYACTTAPFGYKKDPSNPGKLIIDEESSQTVKKIFELKGNGLTINEIVKYLDQNNYITPAVYMNIRGHENIKNKEIWRANSVKRILNNQVYLGHCLRGKTQNISYKSKNKIHIRRNDLIITYNTHEPIISEETFCKVHPTNKYGCSMKNRKEHNNLLHGLLYCKECGRKLNFRNYRNQLKVFCSYHRENVNLCHNDCCINYKLIEEKIIKQILTFYKDYFSINQDKLYNEYINNRVIKMKSEIVVMNKELLKINSKISSLYNKRLLEQINEEEYRNKYTALSSKRKILSEQITKIENLIKQNEHNSNISNQKEHIQKIIYKLENCDFSKDDINQLINTVEVFKNQVIINFRFARYCNFEI